MLSFSILGCDSLMLGREQMEIGRIEGVNTRLGRKKGASCVGSSSPSPQLELLCREMGEWMDEWPTNQQ